MNKFLPIRFRFDISGVLKLSLLTLLISLLLGGYTPANAQSDLKDEVIFIPPQEAYFIEKRTHARSGGYESGSQRRNTSGNSTVLPRVSNNRKNQQDLAKKANTRTRNDYNSR